MSTAVAKYSYCIGIEKDAAFMERTCERRDDCVYYNEGNMLRYWTDPDYEMFFPPVGTCPYFVPREKEKKHIEDIEF